MDVTRWRTINAKIRECLDEVDPSMTIDCLENLLQEYGEDGMIHYTLGLEYESRNEYEKALYHYIRAYKLFPLKIWRQRAWEAIRRIKTRLTDNKSTDNESELYVQFMILFFIGIVLILYLVLPSYLLL